jgi:tRNA pseudouridine32 synthase/23S rRNA pseudouridine746 synthase
MDRRVITYKVARIPSDDLCHDLTRRSGLSVRRVKEAMQKGAVWLKRGAAARRRIRRATTRLKHGDRIWFNYDAVVLACPPIAASCMDDHGRYSVWYKPAGMFTQGTAFGDHCSLLRWAARQGRRPRPVFPVHRLDREVAGLVLLAHDPQAAAGLSALFRSRAIRKDYLARVEGRLPTTPLAQRIDLPLGGKTALTFFRAAQFDPESDSTQVAITIQTGRLHQIRRHFALIGHPVMGDRRYGAHPLETGIALRAVRLAFICPLTGAPRDYVLKNDAAHHGTAEAPCGS